MECSDISLVENREYLRRFRATLRGMRVPFSGSIDLTARCNLQCVHCYTGPGNDAGGSASEMPTDQVLRFLDEITGAGCLFLLITGGEPLLRKDFHIIYAHAKKLGLLVTLFTNGTKVDSQTADFLAGLPPRAVEITLYGATAAVHDGITRVPGSFDAAMNGIKLLLKKHVRTRLKTILMTLNRHEYHDIEGIARRLGVPFRMDAAIFPRLNGDRDPLKYRVEAKEAVEKEMSDPDRLQAWREYAERAVKVRSSIRLYWCGAGEYCFHVDSTGMLKPCIMSQAVKYRLADGSFADAWNNAMPLVGEKKADVNFACNSCDRRSVCNTCPAFFALENGSEEAYSKYLCELATERQSLLSRPDNLP